MEIYSVALLMEFLKFLLPSGFLTVGQARAITFGAIPTTEVVVRFHRAMLKWKLMGR
jgi:hypothetical protein